MTTINTDLLVRKNIDPEIIHCIKLLSKLDGADQYETELNNLVNTLDNLDNKDNITEAIGDLYNKVHGSHYLLKSVKWAATKLIFTIAVIVSVPVGLFYSPLFIGTSVWSQLKHNWMSRRKTQKKRHLLQDIPSAAAKAIAVSLACAYAYSGQITRLFKSKSYALQCFLTERLNVISNDQNNYTMDNALKEEGLKDYLASFQTLDSEVQLDTTAPYTISLRFHTIHAGWIPGNPLKGHLGNHGQIIVEIEQGDQKFYRYYDAIENAKNNYEQEVLRKPAIIELGAPTWAAKGKIAAILQELDKHGDKEVVSSVEKDELLTLLNQHYHMQNRYDMRYFPDVWLASNKEKQAAAGAFDEFKAFFNDSKSDEEIGYMHSAHKYIRDHFFPGFFDCVYYQSVLAGFVLDKSVSGRPTSKDLSEKCTRAGKGMDFGLHKYVLGFFLAGVPTSVDATKNEGWFGKN